MSNLQAKLANDNANLAHLTYLALNSKRLPAPAVNCRHGRRHQTFESAYCCFEMWTIPSPLEVF